MSASPKQLNFLSSLLAETEAGLAAAKAWLTDYFSWNAGYPRVPLYSDGTVVHHHPSYPPSALEIVVDVYAARIGSTPEAEIEAAKKRAAKRR